jgi:hypothetical protein
MPEQDIITPAEVVQPAPEPTVQTISDVLEAPVEKQPNHVPESAFLKEKMARKEAEKRIKELEAKIQSNVAPHSEVAEDIASIAKEFDIDPSFLDKLEKSIRSKTEREVEDKISSKFKPMEEKERQMAIDKAFDTHYGTAIASMPEFKDIVNPAVIKSLSLLPQNGNKTFTQLIEETYGSAVTGKRTITPTTPGGGKDPQPLDYQRAQKDKAYFNEIMQDPKRKAEYNNIMLTSGF